MPRKNKPYTAKTFKKLLKIPDESGIGIFDISKGKIGDPELDKNGFIRYQESSGPNCSGEQVLKLLEHPLSIVINPGSAASMIKYHQLVDLLYKKADIKLPLPFKLANKRRKKLDRFQWSYNWTKKHYSSYECFFNLGKRLALKFHEKANCSTGEPWDTMLASIVLQKCYGVEDMQPEVFKGIKGFEVKASTKAKIQEILKNLLQETKPENISDALLEKVVDKLSKLDCCSPEEAAVNAFSAITDIGCRLHQKFIIPSKNAIPCRAFVSFLRSGDNKIPFPINVQVNDKDNKLTMEMAYPAWEITISNSTPQRYLIEALIKPLDGPPFKPEPKKVDIETLTRFLSIWLVGEYGIHVASEKKTLIPGEEPGCESLTKQILHHHSVISQEAADDKYLRLEDIGLLINPNQRLIRKKKTYKICCLKYNKPGRICPFPGNLLMGTTDRIETFLKAKLIKKILQFPQSSIPLLQFKSSLSNDSLNYDFSKFCLLSSIIHIKIDDEILENLLVPIRSKYTLLKSSDLKYLLRSLREGLASQSISRTVTYSDHKCEKS